MSAWWAAEIEERLSQGDVVLELPFAAVRENVAYLSKETKTGGRLLWAEGSWAPDHQGIGHFLSRGLIAPGLVITHSCELDKSRRRRLVHVAPLHPLDRMQEPQRTEVLEQKTRGLLGLPDVPHLGFMYADLRAIAPMGRELLDGKPRVASMANEGQKRLQAQLVGFFVRLKVDPADLDVD